MDFTDIDNLITRLEKKKTMRPGSPPTILNGHRGIWRMVRHFRVFIELDGSKAGKILVGPPSFVGHKLDKIPSDVWEKMTPRHTLKEFRGIKVADNGIDTLKNAIKNAVAPDDTRIDSLDSMKTHLQLVPIARSAGFTDDEIKQALKGDMPNKPIKDISGKDDKPDAPKADKPDKDDKDEKPEDDKPVDVLLPPGTKASEESKEKPSTSPNAFIDGATAYIMEIVEDPKPREGESATDYLARTLSEGLEKGKFDGDELFKKQVEKAVAKLKSGDATVADVAKKFREIRRNKKAINTNAPTDDQLKQMKDRARVKEFIEDFDKKIEEKVKEKVDEAGKKFQPEPEPDDGTKGLPEELKRIIEEGRREAEEAVAEAKRQREEAKRQREAAEEARRKAQEAMDAGQLERMRTDAALALLAELADQLESEQAKREVEKLQSTLRTSPFNRRSILLRLYQLFQLLLLFIPM